MHNIASTAEWNFNGIGLSVDFKNNEKISYMFVMNDGTKYSAGDLMKLTNLNSSSNLYSVTPQQALGRSGITGIHVNIN